MWYKENTNREFRPSVKSHVCSSQHGANPSLSSGDKRNFMWASSSSYNWPGLGHFTPLQSPLDWQGFYIYCVYLWVEAAAWTQPDTLLSWQTQQVERCPRALIQVNRRSGHCRGWSVWPSTHNPPRDYSTPVSHIIATNHRSLGSLFSHFYPAQPQPKNGSVWRKITLHWSLIDWSEPNYQLHSTHCNEC